MKTEYLVNWVYYTAQCGEAVVFALSKFYGQATKGARWMPWRREAMKDVAGCEKPRRVASRL